MRFVRAVAALSGAVCIGLALPAPAWAVDTPCKSLEVGFATSLDEAANVYAPGVFGTRTGVIHNTIGVAFPGMTFDFDLGTNNPNSGSAPVVQWSFAGGPWRGMTLQVPSNTYQGLQSWVARDVPMPDLPPGDTTVHLRIAFRADNPRGTYDTQFNLSSSACANTMLGSDTVMSYFYWPTTPPPSTTRPANPAPTRPVPTQARTVAPAPAVATAVGTTAAAVAESATPSAGTGSPGGSAAPPDSATPNMQVVAGVTPASADRFWVLGGAMVAVLAVGAALLLWRRRSKMPM